jgi:DNA-binding transcriptional LysR family regulator
MDRLTSMAVFVRAADLGSFAAAADELDMSATMVGKHVRFLEQRLRVQLINRTTRRQTLTEFGRTYYERCRAILTEADAADALATDQIHALNGRLRVTAPVHFGRHCVLPVLLALVRDYPGLELDLSFSDRLLDLAEDGYDLAIRTGTLEPAPGLVARHVASQAMTVCAAPIYLERHGRPAALDDLGAHAALAYRRTGPVPPWLFPRDGQAPVEVRPPNRIRLDDLDAIADAAAAGAGIAWLPRWLVRERLRNGALVELFAGQPGYMYDVHALWLQTPHVARRIRVTVDALAATLPKMMA